MDLRAIKAASRSELTACAIAAARNSQGLLHDAEMLAGSGSTPRAYSLAVLAVEESGKAIWLAALAVLPQKVKARAAVGRMLQWHQLKQAAGLLVAAVTIEAPGTAAKLAAMPATQLTQVMSSLSVPAEEADRLKRRGLYVDMDPSGRIREPSEITEAEVNRQLARARQAAASAGLLLGPDAEARIANPPPEAIEFMRALVTALTQVGYDRTPEAAAEVMRNAVRKLKNSTAAIPGDG